MISAKILSDKYTALKKWAEDILNWIRLDYEDASILKELLKRYKEITNDK